MSQDIRKIYNLYVPRDREQLAIIKTNAENSILIENSHRFGENFHIDNMIRLSAWKARRFLDLLAWKENKTEVNAKLVFACCSAIALLENNTKRN